MTNTGSSTSTGTDLPEDWRELPPVSSSSSVPSDLFFRVVVPPTSTPQKLSDEGTPRAIQSNDNVLINIVGRQADNLQHMDGPIFQQAKSWLVTVGDPFSLTRPIESALLQMSEGQTAQVYVEGSSRYHPFNDVVRKHYKAGESEPYVVPAQSSLLFEISANQIVMDTSKLNPYFTIQKTLTLKNIANDLYQNEWQLIAKQRPHDDTPTTTSIGSSSSKNSRERAIYLYEKTAKLMRVLLGGTYFASVEPDHPQRKQSQTILMDSLNNIIAVYLRAKRWKQAREAAQIALKEDSKNVKAQLRNVKAHVLDPNYLNDEETRQALDKAESVVCYKDAEEKELKQLRGTWKRNKKGQQ